MTSRSNLTVVASTIDHEARKAAESERALLGALLYDSAKAWPAVKDLVSAADFARPDHRLLFGAIAGLIADVGSADPHLLIDRLGDQLEAAGGVDYIAGLYEDCLSASNAAAYAKTVRSFAARGKVIDLAEQMAARARMGDATEAAVHFAAGAERIAREHADKIESYTQIPVSAWADDPEPPPREWVFENMIPAARVTAFFGAGGLGKTLIALQMGLHASTGRPLFGIPVNGGPVLGIFCEDEKDELNRRLRAACAAEGFELADVDRFVAMSRDGEDNVLCTFEADHIRFTREYHRLEQTIAEMRPRLVILDTAADLFAGDFNNPAHARQFVKVALGGLCVRYGCAIVLLIHPSRAAINSGDGGGWSIQWDAAVRSRLYLRRQKEQPAEGEEPAVESKDHRILEVKKTNYGPGDVSIPLVWNRGCFVPDGDPVELARPRVNGPRLALAALDVIRATEPAVTSFGSLFDSLKAKHGLSGDYESGAGRKALYRALKQLENDGLITKTGTPKGYRGRDI